MNKTIYHVIGVMSGTSLDGIDLAYCHFSFDEKWMFSIEKAETVSYSEYWVNTLQKLTQLSLEELKVVDVNYTKHLSDVIKQFILKHNITDIDAVCSHGHTALHQPENQLTYQIGNLPEIATLIKNRVVCDFRIQDVKLGGQGAPLVPIGDELLFSEYDFCLNLGGFANISTKINNERIAYDVCPANIVLNYYVNTLGLDYDDGGSISKSGTLHQELLAYLNQLPFYNEPAPKSLGLEWVQQYIYPLINGFNLEVKDILRTVVEHSAIQISKTILQKNNATLLITGGGAFNTFLIERIGKLSECKVVIPSNAIVNFKEALVFAFLGVLRLRNQTNCLKSVTGASKNHSSGNIFYPQ